jgi:hypothetical protein
VGAGWPRLDARERLAHRGEESQIDKHIADRRRDKEFKERLRRRMEEDRDVLEALVGPDVPVRLWRRALTWVRSQLKRRRRARLASEQQKTFR